jgi:hypothetical protein
MNLPEFLMEKYKRRYCMKLQNVRHGDMCLIGIDKLPEGLTASKSKVLMTGSHGNNHSFTGNGTFYPHEEVKGTLRVVGYLEAREGTKLTHLDHGPAGKKLREVPIQGLFQARKQTADTHAGMRPVED